MLYQPVSLDHVFRALADPTRRGMVERLVGGPATVSELALPYDMTLPAVLQHLAVLQDSGLVQSDKVGRVRTFHLEPAALQTAQNWLDAQRSFWESGLDRLAGLLDEYPEQQAEGRTP
jgi:DNA-binding transcriptional ArsR family regulator